MYWSLQAAKCTKQSYDTQELVKLAAGSREGIPAGLSISWAGALHGRQAATGGRCACGLRLERLSERTWSARTPLDSGAAYA